MRRLHQPSPTFNSKKKFASTKIRKSATHETDIPLSESEYCYSPYVSLIQITMLIHAWIFRPTLDSVR